MSYNTNANNKNKTIVHRITNDVNTVGPTNSNVKFHPAMQQQVQQNLLIMGIKNNINNGQNQSLGNHVKTDYFGVANGTNVNSLVANSNKQIPPNMSTGQVTGNISLK